jgi:hypothetical protein
MRLCFTEDEDALLAKGWPHLVRFVDGHPHDRSPARSALAWLATSRDDKYHSEWPREVGYRVLRFGPRIKMATGTVASTKLNKLDLAHAETSGPPDLAELKKALIQTVASFSTPTTPVKGRDWVLLAEAALGTDQTLDAIAAGFEQTRANPRLDVFKLRFKQSVASVIAFMLLRTARREEHVERLSVQLARFSAIAAKHAGWSQVTRDLDASLNGSVAVKRWLGTTRMSVHFAQYAADDPDYVRACVATDKTAPMAVRIVAIAGATVMKDITKRRWPAADLPSVVRDFGMIRAPETVELVLSLVGKSSVKDMPLRWLQSRVDYARPLVERAAKRGSASAKRVLGRVR